MTIANIKSIIRGLLFSEDLKVNNLTKYKGGERRKKYIIKELNKGRVKS